MYLRNGAISKTLATRKATYRYKMDSKRKRMKKVEELYKRKRWKRDKYTLERDGKRKCWRKRK